MLATEIGRLLVTARRKGTTWYLGGLAAGAPRSVDLPLRFLGPGIYVAAIWQDVAEANVDPNRLSHVRTEVTSLDTLRLPVAGDGGFVAEFVPRPLARDN